MGNFTSKRSDTISTVSNECDRISKLPNDVLCHILSFLETKHAVRSSALSKRWKNLFTLVPVLSFHGSDQGGRTTHNQFIAFVYNVFGVYEITNMQSFILDYDFLIPSSSHIHSWVFNAISRNVRELCLKIDSDDMVSLPREICTSKTLVKLELTGNFTLTFGSYMCLPGLKTLRLYDVYISMEEGLKNLRFSIFPVLEHLVLQCFYDPDVRFDISISSLKTLQLLMQPKQASNIIINAPALERLVFLGNRLTYISGKMLASLVEAEFCFFSPFENCDGLRNLVKMCSNANNLLFEHSMEALIDYELPRFQKLTCLELKIVSGWKLLPDLLESSPNLEILIIDVGEHYLQLQEDGEIEHLLALRDCACSSVHLKELKFQNFSGIEHEFKLVEYILKNAEVLNKSKQSSLGQEVQFQCNYCEKDISDVVRMKCHVCRNFNLCVECFSVGAEVWPHKMITLIGKSYLSRLSARIGVLIKNYCLEDLDIFGLYNWAKVAEHVRTKSEQECAEHYNTYYLSAPNFIPEMKEADNIIAMAKGEVKSFVVKIKAEDNDLIAGTSSISRRSETIEVKDGSSSQKSKTAKIGEELQEIEKQLSHEMGFSTEYYTRMQANAELVTKGRIAKKSDAHGIFVKVESSKVDMVYDVLMKKQTAPSS